MRFRIAVLMCFVFAMATALAAQTRVVTNADLEKYRQERLKTEREYRESYERLGMPSPAELDRRREQSRIETIRLSSELRDAEIERERLDARRDAYAEPSFNSYPQPVIESRGYAPAYFYSYGRRRRFPSRSNYFQQSGYVGGGQFWPTGSGTRPQPLIKRMPRQ